MNDRIETGVWTSIAEGRDYIGAFLNCGELGIEAYDANDVMLGVFADEDDAFNAISDCWDRKLRFAACGDPALAGEFEEPGLQPGPLAAAFPMLAAALGYATRGWDVFPAPPGKKKSHKSAEFSNGANWGKTRDPEEIRRDFRRWPEANIGIPTGKDNGIWVIEADTPEGNNVDGIASLTRLEAQHGPLPTTLMAESPSGSLHRYFKWPEGIVIKNSASTVAPGIDVRGEGGMVIAPPSRRGDGEYRWLNDNDIAEAPQWLLGLVATKPRSSDKSAGNGAQQPSRLKIAEAFKHLEVKPLGDGIVFDKTPLPFEPIKAECGWLRHVHETGGADQPEPLWKLALNACGFLKEPERLIHELSDKHPDYEPDETEAKWERALQDQRTKDLGWPKCTTIRDNGATQCLSCPHLAAEGSPLHLAPRQRLPAEPSFVDPYAEFVGPPFPLDVLPPTLAEFVDAEHRNMGVDPSGLAIAALTAVAGATHAETLVFAGEGWWERPILWGFLIGHPSAKKTPVIRKTMKPLSRIDHERRKIRQAEYAAWRQAQQGVQKEKVPPPPRPPRCIVMDITPEKLAEVLSRNPCGSLMVRDELAGWISNFERYNSDSRGFYLETWDGGTSVKDRMGKGVRDEDAEIHVDNLALCILGGIQPDKLVALGDLTSDGLLQRGLPCLMRPAERGNQYCSVAEAEAAYDKLIRSINDALPEKYLFDRDALEVRDQVNDDLFELELVDGFSSALIAAIGKLHGYFARICLVLEVAKQHDPASLKVVPDKLKIASAFAHLDPAQSLISGSKAISRATAEAAQRIIDQFLLPHIFGLYDVIVNRGQERDMIHATGDFILASTKDRLLPSDLTTGVRALRGQPEHKIREWAGRFCAMGWLQGEEIRPGIPPKAWLVVPGLREHFAERRKQAKAARARVHAILKAGGKQRRGAGHSAILES